MARPVKPPRLWLRPERKVRGVLTHGSVWVIIDAGRQYSTGCRPLDIDGAERALETWLAKQRTNAPLETNKGAHEVLVADVLRYYAEEKGKAVARTTEFIARQERLLAWWGDKTLAQITRATCRQYVAQRSTSQAARRELEDLSAAIGLAIADGICREQVKVTLPKKAKSRSGYIERDAMAKLIWHCYRAREVQTIHRGPRKGEKVVAIKRPLLHVARFLLGAVYSGSRSARVHQASYIPQSGRPWIDLENGAYHREAADEQAADNKRAPPIRIPPRLLAHMRRWHRLGDTYLVQYRGLPADPKKALRKAMDTVLGKGSGFVRHHTRHTAASWLMQSGEDMNSIADYLGMTREILEDTYGHLHPEHQSEIGQAFTTGRAGKRKAG